MSRLICLLTVVCFGHVSGVIAAQNQKNAKSQTSQQAKQELDAAKDKLKDANQDLNKAEKEADKAESVHQSALAKIQKARQAALVEHGKRLGLPTAVAQHAAAQRAFDISHTALVKEVRAGAGHQAATESAGIASARLQQIRDDNALTTEKKQQATAELAKTLHRPFELERERVDADANLQQLRLKIAEAARQVTVIQGQVAKAAEGDSDVKAAQQAEHAAADKWKAARAEVDKQRKDVVAAQKKMATESQQFQKAQSQSQSKTKKGKDDK